MGVNFSAMGDVALLADRDPERVSAWVFDSPSDEDLALLCAIVSNFVNLLIYRGDATEEEIAKWELVEEQVLHQVAERWMRPLGIVRESGWWLDAAGHTGGGQCECAPRA